MARSKLSMNPAAQERMLTIYFDRDADRFLLASVEEAMKAAGEQFVKDNMDKILAELKTENIEKYVAKYVAKHLELKIKEI